MGGVTDFLLDPAGTGIFKKPDMSAQNAMVAQQQAELKKQKDAEQAKEDAMNRQRMADMRSRVGGGFGDSSDATG